jgi:hypothetical protein
MKKHAHFTLLEILISCFLLGILLTFLFSFFKQNLSAKQHMESVKEQLLRVELFKMRLEQLLDGFSEAEGCFIKTIAHADAKGFALLLYSNLGIDPDPSFSGKGYSMLFKTEDARLCLCYWSKDKKPKVDTLLCGVSALSLSFFSERDWHQDWPKNKKSPAAPSMLKISLTLEREKHPQDFIFSLSNEKAVIEIL